ncbi:MAG: hypothetical protein UU16_C0040G0019 [Candidatus Woesebacteria bacterium GW2011_GWA2_40_7]|uniref:Uncharacterized protein n=2 Tax=Candidatus Woeseibacteriota TaxID=1752722 RepID=A0A0G0LUA7_9BACT|nr:MAG: hypothetical protein UT17_C0005G0018 [Candidatus Woesebacteria bacterium GW2011_GWB1_39_10]KKR72431.1 MAG: hypothetical protein UU16_C0040G0019 [Candidatus Woesebacteria bacterium GW2011_GWA2_40_7]
MLESISIQDGELAKLPELGQYVIKSEENGIPFERIEVDGFTLFMNGHGEHSWSRDPKAYRDWVAIQ